MLGMFRKPKENQIPKLSLGLHSEQNFKVILTLNEDMKIKEDGNWEISLPFNILTAHESACFLTCFWWKWQNYT